MKRWLLPVVLFLAALACGGSAQAQNWTYHDYYYGRGDWNRQDGWVFHHRVYQDLGPTYRFPLGYSARADFYYGYMNHPSMSPWWVTQAYEQRYRSWTGSAYDPREGEVDEEYYPAQREPSSRVPLPEDRVPGVETLPRPNGGAPLPPDDLPPGEQPDLVPAPE